MPSTREQPADWDQVWRREALDASVVADQALTPRWRAQEEIIMREFQTFEGLRVIEIGSGRGLNAALYAQRNARVTLLDQSEIALGQARALFKDLDLPLTTVKADAFALPSTMVDAFDVSMSFGLCEHFLDLRRQEIVAAHLRVLRDGGIAMLGVPNRFAPAYRVVMGLMKARGSWQLGTEVPFSVRELRALARRVGGQPLEPQYGSAIASLVGQGVNPVLRKIGHSGLIPPQITIPVLDRLAYELLFPVRRNGPVR